MFFALSAEAYCRYMHLKVAFASHQQSVRLMGKIIKLLDVKQLVDWFDVEVSNNDLFIVQLLNHPWQKSQTFPVSSMSNVFSHKGCIQCQVFFFCCCFLFEAFIDIFEWLFECLCHILMSSIKNKITYSRFNVVVIGDDALMSLIRINLNKTL